MLVGRMLTNASLAWVTSLYVVLMRSSVSELFWTAVSSCRGSGACSWA